MVSLLRKRTTSGRRECFWTFDLSDRALADEPTASPTGKTPVLRYLLRFQRNEAAAALAPNANENLLGCLQSFADGHQVLRISYGLLVHFLNHVAFAQPSFCDGGV